MNAREYHSIGCSFNFAIGPSFGPSIADLSNGGMANPSTFVCSVRRVTNSACKSESSSVRSPASSRARAVWYTVPANTRLLPVAVVLR